MVLKYFRKGSIIRSTIRCDENFAGDCINGAFHISKGECYLETAAILDFDNTRRLGFVSAPHPERRNDRERMFGSAGKCSDQEFCAEL